RGAAVDAELLLDHAGGRGKDHVRRRSRDDDEIERLRIAIGGGQRTLRGLEAEVAARHAVRSEMAKADAGPLDDPLVRGFDAVGRQPLGQRRIADPVRRQEAAGTGDARVKWQLDRHADWAATKAGAPLVSAVPGMAASVARMRSCTRSSRPLLAAS